MGPISLMYMTNSHKPLLPMVFMLDDLFIFFSIFLIKLTFCTCFRASLGWFAYEPEWFDMNDKSFAQSEAQSVSIFVQHLINDRVDIPQSDTSSKGRGRENGSSLTTTTVGLVSLYFLNALVHCFCVLQGQLWNGFMICIFLPWVWDVQVLWLAHWICFVNRWISNIPSGDGWRTML